MCIPNPIFRDKGGTFCWCEFFIFQTLHSVAILVTQKWQWFWRHSQTWEPWPFGLFKQDASGTPRQPWSSPLELQNRTPSQGISKAYESLSENSANLHGTLPFTWGVFSLWLCGFICPTSFASRSARHGSFQKQLGRNSLTNSNTCGKQWLGSTSHWHKEPEIARNIQNKMSIAVKGLCQDFRSVCYGLGGWQKFSHISYCFYICPCATLPMANRTWNISILMSPEKQRGWRKSSVCKCVVLLDLWDVPRGSVHGKGTLKNIRGSKIPSTLLDLWCKMPHYNGTIPSPRVAHCLATTPRDCSPNKYAARF